MRRFISCFALAIGFHVVFIPLSAAETGLEVAADGVGLTVEPQVSCKPVVVLSKGASLLAAQKTTGEWIAVKPPADIGFWVYSELVENGVVLSPQLQVRTGPGIGYPVAFVLKKGDRIAELERSDDWIRIACSPDLVFWIRKDGVVAANVVLPERAIEIPERRQPSAAVRDAEGGRDVPELPTAAVPPSPSPARRPLTESAESRSGGEQATAPSSLDAFRKGVEYSGIIRPAAPVWRRPSRFRLAETDDKGRLVTVCYIRAKESVLEPLIGASVSLTGREYSVQGVKHPVVVPDRIVVRKKP